MDNTIDIVRHPRQVVKIKVDIPLHEYDFMRIKLIWQIHIFSVLF